MDNTYGIALEVEGPFAMFARPDAGSTPVSYPVPTYSAAKGIFEAVARIGQVLIKPVRLEVCKPIRFERYVTNYGGPLRKGEQVKNGNNYQLFATVLVDVHYRLYAELVPKRLSTNGSKRPVKRRRHGAQKDWASIFKAKFDQRLANGQTYYTPCLGWKEFVPSYFGPVRPDSKCDTNIHLTLPSFLKEMWQDKRLKPQFGQDWQIVAGAMSYQHRSPDDAQ
jgi:CRISPR-associated protein Cas5d